jgi:signal transduction histidine kinase
MLSKLIGWFIPFQSIRGRTNIELARVFVFTHLFGPLIAQPMAFYLYFVSPELSLPLIVMVGGIWAFWLLPFVLRQTGNMMLCALLSFQGLAGASLFGTYFYGGFSSPFLPWLIVSLLLGFFYLSKRVRVVLMLFGLDLMVFTSVIAVFGFPEIVKLEDLRILGWLSIVAAAVYMSWMALYYARMIALRSELKLEADRYRSALVELEQAKVIAEKTSRNRSLFFAKMSHELRTPLNSIIGYSEILLDDCNQSAEKDDQRSKDLRRINAAGKHLLSLVSDVLDVNTMERDALAVDPSVFKLGDLCDEVIASALPMIEKNGNRLVLDCPDRGEVVRTDHKKLRQMIINLLSNAGKFTEGGTVKLHMNVDAGVADDRLCISVSDTGIGISQDALPRLFEDYMQADASISKRFGGTGIGLALTRKFSVLLGGEVSVQSTLGQGACFTIDIPANLQRDMDHREKTDTSRNGESGETRLPEGRRTLAA